MLKLINVSKSFDKNIIIENFSHEFSKKGITVISGNSGRGKTTLLNIIAGLIPCDSGEIENRYKSIAYSFQEPRLFDWLTVLENVAAVLPEGNQSADSRKKALSALEKVGLSNDIDKYPSELSGGMKQRVSLARAFAYDAELILFDEPFKELENELAERVAELIKEEGKNKKIILVTHNSEMLEYIADEIIKLQ